MIYFNLPDKHVCNTIIQYIYYIGHIVYKKIKQNPQTERSPMFFFSRLYIPYNLNRFSILQI